MSTATAANIRRGILIARSGADLTFRQEDPATIDAYLHTASKETP